MFVKERDVGTSSIIFCFFGVFVVFEEVLRGFVRWVIFRISLFWVGIELVGFEVLWVSFKKVMLVFV